MAKRRRKDDFLPEVPQDVLAAGAGPTDIPFDRSNPVVGDTGGGAPAATAAPPVPDQGATPDPTQLGAAGAGAGGVGSLAALGAGGGTDQLTGSQLGALGGGAVPVDAETASMIVEAARRIMMAGGPQ